MCMYKKTKIQLEELFKSLATNAMNGDLYKQRYYGTRRRRKRRRGWKRKEEKEKVERGGKSWMK